MPSRADLIPWPYVITADDGSKCPSSTAILGTFAAINILSSLLGVAVGHRKVVKTLTFGLLGSKDDISAILFVQWLIPLACQLGSNAINAYLMSKVPGYTVTFPIGQLVVLYAARPRFSWIVLAMFTLRSTITATAQKKTRAFTLNDMPKLSPWFSAGIAHLLVEIVLDLMALAYMGRTAYFATRRGYLNVFSSAYDAIPESARLMYAGSLWFIVAGVISGFYYVCFIVEALKSPSLARDGPSMFWSGVVFFGISSTWISAWLFWAGYVKLAGDLYCPPKLASQGAVWIIFTTLGIFFGSP
ncbi:hypothetical protein K432DRAFT_379848 [Lepidopterella palustris CBS 459.81]|uniref:Uncharacterized protein n=1 Tax=Lepidopterella palustris CBS 459.81 TaxID=1314670 RepID=A0A8E2EFZ6_9PEZI|nr:hypothetical protein K432DRAFT_379848 [Lepidopterella palustris CBS 459.81]